MRKKKKKLEPNIQCECGYCNKEAIIKIYGTCNLCGKVLDPKAKYRYEMKKKLRLIERPKRRIY